MHLLAEILIDYGRKFKQGLYPQPLKVQTVWFLGNRLYRFMPHIRSYVLLDAFTLYMYCCYNKENKKHVQNNKIR